VGETGIGSLSELRWIVGVLCVLRIEDGEQRWGLPTVSRSHREGPVSVGDRSRENGMEKKCANARTCTRGARGRARGPEEDVPMREQELAPRRRTWQPRRSSGRSNATWRTQGRASTGSGGRRCDSSCTCKLDIYFVSVKYVLDSVKLVYAYVKLLKI
jgi:hypothetical protein